MDLKQYRMVFIVGILFFLVPASGPFNVPGPVSMCGHLPVDPRTTLCCQGLVYLRGQGQTVCCGRVAYDMTQFLCCHGDRVARKRGQRSACCGIRAYDTGRETCMYGRIHQKAASEHSLSVHYNIQRDSPHTNRQKDERKTGDYPHGLINSYRNTAATHPHQVRTADSATPSCCHHVTVEDQADCCSSVLQSTAVMPSCCHSDQVRPTCCRDEQGLLMCCSYKNKHCCTGDESSSNSTPARHYISNKYKELTQKLTYIHKTQNYVVNDAKIDTVTHPANRPHVTQTITTVAGYNNKETLYQSTCCHFSRPSASCCTSIVTNQCCHGYPRPSCCYGYRVSKHCCSTWMTMVHTKHSRLSGSLSTVGCCMYAGYQRRYCCRKAAPYDHTACCSTLATQSAHNALIPVVPGSQCCHRGSNVLQDRLPYCCRRAPLRSCCYSSVRRPYCCGNSYNVVPKKPTTTQVTTPGRGAQSCCDVYGHSQRQACCTSHYRQYGYIALCCSGHWNTPDNIDRSGVTVASIVSNTTGYKHESETTVNIRDKENENIYKTDSKEYEVTQSKSTSGTQHTFRQSISTTPEISRRTETTLTTKVSEMDHEKVNTDRQNVLSTTLRSDNRLKGTKDTDADFLITMATYTTRNPSDSPILVTVIPATNEPQSTTHVDSNISNKEKDQKDLDKKQGEGGRQERELVTGFINVTVKSTTIANTLPSSTTTRPTKPSTTTTRQTSASTIKPTTSQTVSIPTTAERTTTTEAATLQTTVPTTLPTTTKVQITVLPTTKTSQTTVPTTTTTQTSTTESTTPTTIPTTLPTTTTIQTTVLPTTKTSKTAEPRTTPLTTVPTTTTTETSTRETTTPTTLPTTQTTVLPTTKTSTTAEPRTTPFTTIPTTTTTTEPTTTTETGIFTLPTTTTTQASSATSKKSQSGDISNNIIKEDTKDRNINEVLQPRSTTEAAAEQIGNAEEEIDIKPIVHITEPPIIRPEDKQRGDIPPEKDTGEKLALCNGYIYDRQFRMCCNGQLRRKIGVSPACCGQKGYDALLYQCCDGDQIRRSCHQHYKAVKSTWGELI